MPPLDIPPPTTSLPTLNLDPRQCAIQVLEQGLMLNNHDILDLLQVAAGIMHAIQHGNATLAEVPELQKFGTNGSGKPVLTLTQLDLVVHNPELTTIVKGYSTPISLPDEQIRMCRSICSGLRLYWFTYSTLRWLRMCSDSVGNEEFTGVMWILRQLGDAVDLKTELAYLRQELGDPPRRDRQNNDILVFNQEQLWRIINDPQEVVLTLVWGATPPIEVTKGIDALRILLNKLDKPVT